MGLLKGNYKLKKTVVKNKPTEEEKLEILLEQKAHKKLGGSMVYVSKKKVNWK